MRPQQKFFLFYVKKCIQKEETSKTDEVLINQVIFTFETRKYASFSEMNMILVTTKCAQLMSFDSRNMYYPSSKF